MAPRERPSQPPGLPQRYRWMFHYSIGGDLRFISHHDTLRLFRRALARADIPVRFSEGFNPHPRMTIPLPRPVGVASEAEAIVIETAREIDLAKELEALQRQTPPDLHVIRAERLALGARPRPVWVRYAIAFEGAKPEAFEAGITALTQSDVVPVVRKDPKSGTTRQVDIRPYVVHVRADEHVVEFTLRVTGAGTARPGEVAAALGFTTGPVIHRIVRLEVGWC